MEFIYGLIGGFAGLSFGLGILIWFIFKNKRGAGELGEELKEKIQDLEQNTHSLNTENRLQKEEIQQAENLEAELREQVKIVEQERTEKATQNVELNRRLEDQIEEQEKIAKQMQERFENLANKIF